jgi:uncharacterized membrane protein
MGKLRGGILMKKNPIFLAMLMVILAFSLTFVGCEEEDDSGGDSGKKKSGGVVEWPDDIVFGTSAAYGNKKGDYTSDAGDEMNIYNSVSGTAQACFINGGDVYFVIKSVSGKKITVNDYTSDVVFCTDYTVTGNTLTLTGGEGSLAPYSGITWTRK